MWESKHLSWLVHFERSLTVTFSFNMLLILAEVPDRVSNECRLTNNGQENAESKTLNFKRIGNSTREICLAFRLRAPTRIHEPAQRAGGGRTDQVWQADRNENVLSIPQAHKMPSDPRRRLRWHANWLALGASCG